MLLQILPIPGAISEIFATTTNSGQITLADRYGLMAAMLDENISEEERRSIDRLLYGVRKGRVQIVNDISTIE
jgi:hypothetical protein